jgi:hypothetical protein
MTKQSAHYLDPKNMEEQEHLSLTRLNKLAQSCTLNTQELQKLENDRPRYCFIDLMKWVNENFSHNLKDQINLNKFVHNRIIVDGQFFLFCEENKINIECLYRDSCISWKTEHEFEKFFVQGVFLIKTKDVEFLHAALFHKGNASEDEISFFIICSESNYEGYVKLRNEFDKWVSERDRSNLHIRVVDGDDLPYTKDYTWEDLFLPKDMKLEIKGMIENFLSSQDFYVKNRIPWKRGLLIYGYPGCGKSTLIKTIMSVYNFKPVTISAVATDESVREAFSYAEEQSPSLLYFEDLDSLLEKSIDPSTFLNLMDGVAAKNGLLVIATANEVKKLKPNITDRPSRFDRKFEIPLPNLEMTVIYLRKWFGDLITDKKCKDLAKMCVKYNFSYAYIKEIYISSMFEALSCNRKIPTEKDIQKSLLILVKDKNLLNNGAINMEKYYK